VPLSAGVAVAAVLSYLIGSIPFGYVCVRVLKGVDIRTLGSKNVGATNVMRVAGVGLGLGVLVADVLKGAAAVILVGGWLSARLTGPEITDAAAIYLKIAAGAGAVTGHTFTVFLRFRGGKGVATGLGVVLSLMPLAGLVALATFVVVVAVSRYVSLGSMLAAVVLVIAEIRFLEEPFGADAPLALFSAAVAALVILRHTSNIKRLLAGNENKLSLSRKARDKTKE